jgi:hypothetical protein
MTWEGFLCMFEINADSGWPPEAGKPTLAKLCS